MKIMKKILFLAVTAIMFGCSTDQVSQEPDQIKTKEATTNSRIGPSYLVQPIFAGQNINAGYVEISNDGTNFEVEYFATGNWKFSELHFWINPGICLGVGLAVRGSYFFVFSNVKCR